MGMEEAVQHVVMNDIQVGEGPFLGITLGAFVVVVVVVFVVVVVVVSNIKEIDW